MATSINRFIMGVFFDILAVRSHSSIGLERLATDEKVEGSNPSGTSKKGRKLMNFLSKLSLKNAVIVFFAIVIFIILILSFIL
tara:strand:- start:4182 stop:4430 length:249 start_codon:yes stop_codon:yes gene_type:complete